MDRLCDSVNDCQSREKQENGEYTYQTSSPYCQEDTGNMPHVSRCPLEEEGRERASERLDIYAKKIEFSGEKSINLQD